MPEGYLYLAFFWTFIPTLLSLMEAFMIAGQVATYNQQKAIEIAATLSGLQE